MGGVAMCLVCIHARPPAILNFEVVCLNSKTPQKPIATETDPNIVFF